jgi:hypothetical protein
MITQARNAALRGLDFYVRNQLTNKDSANFGRFPYIYDCTENKIITRTTNWTTGVIVSALLAGYKLAGKEEYLTAAKNGVSYIKSLQDFSPLTPRVQGVFHESTPQSDNAHPRDALTAAWALLDYAIVAEDKDARQRAELYGEWFTEVGLERGYPYWTVRFDEAEWEPSWCGSFHSGSAFFMYRLYVETKKDRYLQGMRKILDFYNKNHLAEDGTINIILDRDSLETLDGKADSRFSNPGWEMMHRYNDDFGALANLAGWKITGDEAYYKAAERFLMKMCAEQHTSGGFGPPEWSVPSGAGAIVQEMLAAKQLNAGHNEYDIAVEKAIPYLLNLQNNVPENPADGAFFGVDENYDVSDTYGNARTAAYAIMALLRYSGAVDDIYFFAKKGASCER